jgi:hypothetical protein
VKVDAEGLLKPPRATASSSVVRCGHARKAFRSEGEKV